MSSLHHAPPLHGLQPHSAGETVAREPLWQVRLLGAVEARGQGQEITRWPSRAVAALLARLALAPGRAHPREELIELLWPGVPLATGRNRLRQALSTLRAMIEPSGPQPCTVLQADRMVVRVLAGALQCDALQFEQAARQGLAQQAQALYRGELMPGFYEDWVFHVRQHLADLHERLAPVRGAEMAAGEPPPLASIPPTAAHAPAAEAPTGLPSYWTRPFGMELTASRLRAQVRTQRLVCVHGPGGSGKTRLAVEVAQALHHTPAWPTPGEEEVPPFERVCFVPLIDCSRADQVQEALCKALHADGQGEPLARLVATLAGRRSLLLLDNLEQLEPDAAQPLARLLAALPQLHLLLTSRRLLGLDGEVAFELDGLALPLPQGSLAQAADNPAVALFVDRARAARPDFHLSERQTVAVAGLARLLGGMPLAIELAATRVRSLTPQQLLQRLMEEAGSPMLDLLARAVPRASADQRHASMRHVVAWSWEQLEAPVQQQLLSMSVLTAPAPLAAVAAAAGLAPAVAEPLVGALQDASLVQLINEGEGEPMLRLLQPVREFAAERLAPALARAARSGLRQWLLGQAPALLREGPRAVAGLLPLVMAAMTSAQADGEPVQGLRLAVALRSYWDSDSLPLSALQALEQALPLCDEAALRADALELLAYARTAAGFVSEGLAHADQALLAAPHGTQRSRALLRWCYCQYHAGHYNADYPRAVDEALALARQAGDLAAEAQALRLRGLLLCNLHMEFAEAERLVAQSQAIWERLDQRTMVVSSLLGRATMWAWLGRNEQGLALMQECETKSQAAGDWLGTMLAARQAGRVCIRLGRGGEAVVALQRSLRMAWERHAGMGVAYGLLHLPEALQLCGQAAAGARLHGFAITHWQRLFPALNRIESREVRRGWVLIRRRLGAVRAESLRAEGSGLSLAEAVGVAMSLKVPG